MSKLNNLMEKLCPDGVEYREIGELFDVKNGYTPSKNNEEYWASGTIPWFRMEDIRLNGKVLNNSIQHITKQAVKNKLFPKNSLMVATTATIGVHALVTTDFLCNQQLTCVSIKETLKNKINIKFYYYYFDIVDKECIKIANQGGGMPIVSLEKMKKLKVPLPPLEIQGEIVKLLDEFNPLTEELSSCLLTESSFRKKQYEYYRDKLLSFENSNVEWKKLGEIATDMYRGAGIKRNEVTETGIPCVRYGEIYTSYNITFNKCISHTEEDKINSKKYFEYGDILFAITGESVEEIGKSIVYMGNEKCLAGGDIVVMKHNQNPKYMGYVLSTTFAQLQKSKGKVKSKVVHTSVPSLKEISIPLPPLEIQEKIATIVEDYFNICNDISCVIPKEIDSRIKEYEYYRDKLLNFKELNADV